MIRISKLADYGTVIMAHLARHSRLPLNAKDVAIATHIMLPTVTKLLKQLAQAGLLASQRGIKGGYYLTNEAEKISLADIINALDGNVALTECSHSKGVCIVERNCAIRRSWRNVSSVISDVLSKVTLAEMIR